MRVHSYRIMYSNVQCILFYFRPTDRTTLEEISSRRFAQVIEYTNPAHPPPLFLVGDTSDLGCKRAVSFEEASVSLRPRAKP